MNPPHLDPGRRRLGARLSSWLDSQLELDRAGATSNLRPMEGLRGAAVFLVFLVHYMSMTMPWWQGHGTLLAIADRVHAMGNVGVDLFFVLSGFLIYGTLLAKVQPYRDFMARRVRRIYPAFLAVFALYVLLSWALPAYSKWPDGLGARALYLVQNLLLLPGLFPIEPLITVAWSLSYEFFFYLLMPLLVGVLGLRRRSRPQRILILLLLGAVAALLFARFGGPVRMLMFVAGMLLFEAHGAGPSRQAEAGGAVRGSLAAGAGLAALWVAMLPAPGPVLQVLKISTLGLLFFLLCQEAFRGQRALVARLLAWTPLRWLGNMSYSYYLIHGLSLHAAVLALRHLLPPSQVKAELLFGVLPPLLFAWTLLPSLVLFIVIERPLSLKPGGRVSTRRQSVLPGMAGIKEKS